MTSLAVSEKALKAYFLAKYAFATTHGLGSYKFAHSERIFSFLGTREGRDRVASLPGAKVRGRMGGVEIIEEMQIVAILHDVLEDAPQAVPFTELAYYGLNVVDDIIAITRGKEEVYEDYIRRVIKNPYARFVKILDIEGHLKSLHELDREAQGRLKERYDRAIFLLHSAGDYDLW